MTLEQLKKINSVADELERERKRLSELDELRNNMDICCDSGTVRCAVIDVSFDREHFSKFLRAEIMSAEACVDRLSKELEKM